MADPSMLGMYGMGAGQNADPNDLAQMLRLHMLLATQQQQKQNGPAGMANQALTMMLMNPELMKKFKNGIGDIGNGFGNWFSGNNWNGTPGAENMAALTNQAAGNAAGGGVLY